MLCSGQHSAFLDVDWRNLSSYLWLTLRIAESTDSDVNSKGDNASDHMFAVQAGD